MNLYTEEQRKLERYNRVCKGKRVFDTEEQAQREAKRLRKSFKMRMRAYRCLEFCGNYHLGHNRHGNQKLFLELTEIVAYQKQYGN